MTMKIVLVALCALMAVATVQAVSSYDIDEQALLAELEDRVPSRTESLLTLSDLPADALALLESDAKESENAASLLELAHVKTPLAAKSSPAAAESVTFDKKQGNVAQGVDFWALTSERAVFNQPGGAQIGNLPAQAELVIEAYEYVKKDGKSETQWGYGYVTKPEGFGGWAGENACGWFPLQRVAGSQVLNGSKKSNTPNHPAKCPLRKDADTKLAREAIFKKGSYMKENHSTAKTVVKKDCPAFINYDPATKTPVGPAPAISAGTFSGTGALGVLPSGVAQTKKVDGFGVRFVTKDGKYAMVRYPSLDPVNKGINSFFVAADCLQFDQEAIKEANKIAVDKEEKTKSKGKAKAAQKDEKKAKKDAKKAGKAGKKADKKGSKAGKKGAKGSKKAGKKGSKKAGKKGAKGSKKTGKKSPKGSKKGSKKGGKKGAKGGKAAAKAGKPKRGVNAAGLRRKSGKKANKSGKLQAKAARAGKKADALKGKAARLSVKAAALKKAGKTAAAARLEAKAMKVVRKAGRVETKAAKLQARVAAKKAAPVRGAPARAAPAPRAAAPRAAAAGNKRRSFLETGLLEIASESEGDAEVEGEGEHEQESESEAEVDSESALAAHAETQMSAEMEADQAAEFQAGAEAFDAEPSLMEVESQAQSDLSNMGTRGNYPGWTPSAFVELPAEIPALQAAPVPVAVKFPPESENVKHIRLDEKTSAATLRKASTGVDKVHVHVYGKGDANVDSERRLQGMVRRLANTQTESYKKINGLIAKLKACGASNKAECLKGLTEKLEDWKAEWVAPRK